jgi:hypothetical protein
VTWPGELLRVHSRASSGDMSDGWQAGGGGISEQRGNKVVRA